MFGNMTIKQRLISVLIIFSSLPTFLMGMTLYDKLYDLRISEKEEIIYDSVTNNSDVFREWIDSKINLIKSLDLLSENLSEDSPLTIYELVRIVNDNSLAGEEVYVFKKNNVNSLSGEKNFNWYIGATKENEIIISEVHKDDFGNDSISIAYDLNFKGEKYVVAIDLAISEIRREIDKLYYNNKFGALLLFGGRIIYIDESIENIPLEKLIFNDTSAVSLEYEKVNLISVNKKLGNEMRIIVTENFSSNLTFINTLKKDFMNLMLVVFIASIFLVLFLSDRFLFAINSIKRDLKNSLSHKANLGFSYQKNYKDMELYHLYKDMVLDNNKLEYNKNQALIRIEKYNNLIDEKNRELEKLEKDLENIEFDIEYSNKKYENLFNNIKDFIWMIDIEGNITLANNAFIEKLGYEKYHILGSRFRDILVEADGTDDFDEFILGLFEEDKFNVSLGLKKHLFSESEFVIFNSRRIIENGKLMGVQFVARTLIDKEILERKMYKRNKELEFIKEISRTLTNSKNLEDLLSSIAVRIKNLIEDGICLIWLLNNDGVLELKVSSNSLLDTTKVDLISQQSDILGDAISRNKVIRITSFIEERNKSYNIAAKHIDKIEEMIFIPLKNNQVPSGVISIGVGSKLSEIDIDILSAFASQSSVAIEKAKLYEKLKLDYFNTIKVLATAVEAKDAYTEGHSIRVSKFAALIGERLDMTDLELEELAISGILHDIGKIGVDDTILTKAGRLNDEEYKKVKKHPEVGARIIRPIELSPSIVEGVLYHHISYDGGGYPQMEDMDIKSKIPYIIGVADALDAMTSNRLYSKKKTIEDAIYELIKFKGTQFSPEIVDIVSEIYKEDPSKLNEISEFDAAK